MSEARDPKKLYPHDKVMRYTILPFIPKFVRPNHFTILRLIATPYVIWLLASGSYKIGIPVFLIVAFTDAIDGSLARVRKQITDWGTFYDPVADKILISGAVVVIVMKHINFYFGLLIIFMEVLIALGGWIHRKKHHIPNSANVWGKMKMILQVSGVTFLLIAVYSGIDLFIDFSIGTLSVGIAFAMVSLYTYSA